MSELTRTPIEKRSRTIKKRPVRAIVADPRSIGVKISQLPLRTDMLGTDEVTTLAGGINYRSPLSAVTGVLQNFAELDTTSISSSVDVIRTLGYYTPGDGGGATYVRRGATEPLYPGKVQSADGAWWEIVAAEFNVRCFGAKGDAVADDRWAIQDAIDRAIKISKVAGYGGAYKVLIPPGRYKITAPLEIFDWVPADPAAVPPTLGSFVSYCTVTIGGETVGYLTNRMTEIFTTYVDRPAFFIQRGRNIRMYGFTITGQANSLSLPRYTELQNDDGPLPWWSSYRDAAYNLTTPSGARDNGYSPYCAIAVDAFHSAIPGSTPANCYPGYDDKYAPLAANSGSSQIAIEYMGIQGFIVGVAFSLSQLQNDETVRVSNCYFTCCKVCIVSGQSQVRGMISHNNHIQGCQVYVDATRYGVGGGDLGTISNGNVVYCKWLIIGNGANGSATVRDVFCESLWSIGIWTWTSGGFPILFERCHFKLIRNIMYDPITGVPSTTPAMDSHFHCGGAAAFYGGYIGFYNNDIRRWTLRNAAPVVFDGNIFLDGVPQCADELLVEFKSVRIKSEGAGASYGVSKEYISPQQTIGVYGTARAPAGCIIHDSSSRRWRVQQGWIGYNFDATDRTITVNPAADGTGSFEATSTSTALMYAVDDELTTVKSLVYYGEAPYPGATPQDYRKCIIGKVTSVVGTTVNLINIPKGVTNGMVLSVWKYELPRIHQLVMGTTAIGSLDITAVTPATSGWAVGYHIYGTGIPTNARVTAVSGTTITISHAATAAGITELYDAKLILDDGPAGAAPTSGVWPRGTFMRNTAPSKDASNMVLRGWICTVTGSPGTWEPQYTSAVSPAT